MVGHRSPVNSPHKGQWRGTLIFSLICARINGWVNNGEAGDLRRHRDHYDVIVMNEEDFINTFFAETGTEIDTIYIPELDISFTDIEQFLHEATISRRLDHPNVLKVIGVSFDRRDCYLVLPFMEKGNLREFLMDKQNVSLYIAVLGHTKIFLS